MKARKAGLAAVAAALVAAALAAFAWGSEQGDKPAAGLFTSLPIFWSETASVAETLEGAGERHWVRTALEADHHLVPLDTLDGAELGKLQRLVIAQPRPLSPSENVALDDWVRAGGRLLLFADPLLTEHSRFPLGDRRRPQDVVLLSPILTRWGLELTFDDEQPDRERPASYRGAVIAERMSGRFRIVTAGAPATCQLAAAGLIAECAIGSGKAVLVADAAQLEADRADGEAAFAALLEAAFAD